MLGDISVVTELYVVCGYTDMRKSIDGLCSCMWNRPILLPCTCSAASAATGSRRSCMSRTDSSCFTKDSIHMSAGTSGLVIKAR